MTEGVKNGVIPPFIKPIDEMILQEMYEVLKGYYIELKDLSSYTESQRKEIAKLILPLGSTTDLVLSGNYQALYEFLQLRLCLRSEWEIHSLAISTKNILKEVMPCIFDKLDCRAAESGVCIEHEKCGKY